MTKALYIVGSATELESLRMLAIEAGLIAYWAKPKRSRSSMTGRHRDKHPIDQTRLGKLLLATMRTNPFKEWHRDDLGIMLEENGYAATSVTPVASKCEQAGLLMRVDPRVYMLTAKGRGDVSTPSASFR